MVFSETNQKLASGTAFIYTKNSKQYLVTNWHNVTGKNPNTKEPLSDHGGIPDTIEVRLLSQLKPHIEWSTFKIRLYDENDEPSWLIHPEHGEIVDVIVREFEVSEDVTTILKPINEIDFADFRLECADDVFILGFPYSLKGGGNFPIWKRGSVATEPDLPIDNLPKILVDTASRPGMSGSPVIFRREGIHSPTKGELTDDTIFGQIQGFVGIYSGRVTSQSGLDAQLGIVWKAEVIDEIIEGQKFDKKSSA